MHFSCATLYIFWCCPISLGIFPKCPMPPLFFQQCSTLFVDLLIPPFLGTFSPISPISMFPSVYCCPLVYFPRVLSPSVLPIMSPSHPKKSLTLLSFSTSFNYPQKNQTSKHFFLNITQYLNITHCVEHLPIVPHFHPQHFPSLDKMFPNLKRCIKTKND